jgi:hypothetical protein
VANLAKLTTRQDILNILSDEYAKVSGEDPKVVLGLMEKAAHQFLEQFRRKRRIKKKLKFWKKS